MNNLTVEQENKLQGLEILPTTWYALKNSLYPGAKDESVMMILERCVAGKLDPFMKPFHIVAMWDKKINGYKDVIMPGIGLYRIIASRTGQHAGTGAPVFGPMIIECLSGVEIACPEWCEITVYKIIHGVKCSSTAREYWLENYAKVNSKSQAPNQMWSKRPRGQLAKCAEAQALRKAFPEEVGTEPTMEEMLGKTIDSTATTIEAKSGVDALKEIICDAPMPIDGEVVEDATTDILEDQPNEIQTALNALCVLDETFMHSEIWQRAQGHELFDADKKKMTLNFLNNKITSLSNIAIDDLKK